MYWNFLLSLLSVKRQELRHLNPCPAEPGYVLPLLTVIQISWLLKKPTDLDLHPAIKYVNLEQ